MNRYEYIKTLNLEQMAKFISLPINCYEIYEDYGQGCSFKCKHNQGEDKIRQWLQEDNDN